jgi:hypothetical protein
MRASVRTCPEEFLCVVKGGWLRSPPAPKPPRAAPDPLRGLFGCQLVRSVEPNNGSDPAALQARHERRLHDIGVDSAAVESADRALLDARLASLVARMRGFIDGVAM